MKRLREQTRADDPVVARTARMFAAVASLVPSDVEMQRVWRGMKGRSHGRGRPIRFRFAVACGLLIGLVAVASAFVGREWIAETISGLRVSKIATVPTPAPALPPPAPARVVPAPVPSTTVPIRGQAEIQKVQEIVLPLVAPAPSGIRYSATYEPVRNMPPPDTTNVPPTRAALPPRDPDNPDEGTSLDELRPSPGRQPSTPIKTDGARPRVLPNEAPILPAR